MFENIDPPTFWQKLGWKVKRIYEYIRYDIPKGLNNILTWLPIVWKDRDYDKDYIYQSLRFKLNKMADYLERRNTFVGVEVEVRYLRLCVKLLDYLITDKYFSDLMDDFHKRWGDSDFVTVDSKEHPDFTELLEIKYANANTPEEKEECEKMFTSYINTAHTKQEKAKKLLFNIINKRIDGWWD